MTPETWQRIREIFEELIELSPGERYTRMQSLCGADPDLQSEVASLLRAHEEAGTFLGTPAAEMLGAAPVPDDIPFEPIGSRIGPYEVLEKIGHGGMGEVYRAVRADGEYRKDVAIKLVRSGVDARFLLDRFRRERQILASLEHPNIARLLDGGTTDDGFPYLVMELIDGMPIDEYCDVHKLDIQQRIELFLPICGAVQYAHQRLVIHRDLKPTNIIVTPEGIPKLLDFGIASMLDPAGTQQKTLAHPMTLEYASPEQIRGEPITTATDIYSLGVVLYRLLTHCLPYPSETVSPHELARLICDRQPERPSAVMSRTQ